jgi:hypothetical protein
MGKKRFNDDPYKISDLLLNPANAELKKDTRAEFFVPFRMATSALRFYQLPSVLAFNRADFVAAEFARIVL